MALRISPIQDQQNWRGIIGIIPGELVQQFNAAINEAITAYTVPAGKTLYITYFSYVCAYDSTGGGANIILKDSNSNEKLLFASDPGVVNTGSQGSVSTTVPIVCPENYFIVLTSNNATSYCYFAFQGYLI